MKNQEDYIRDLAEIRSMMERSSKFMSLSGWAGILAGIYALTGAYIAYVYLDFNPDQLVYDAKEAGSMFSDFTQLIALALLTLLLAIGTAILLSMQKAHKRSEKAWNATSKRLLIRMSVPLVAGGLLVLILLSKGLVGLLAPLTLLFYGLALYNASMFTYDEVKSLGIIQICLGLMSTYFISYGLFFWATGFGVVHIAYGMYMHLNYER